MTDCIEWTGYRHRNSYGSVYSSDLGKNVLVHRLSMAQLYGWEYLEGKVVRHTCDNPPCYNPQHLRVGTQADNIADRDAKGRHGTNGNELKTHCPQGHAYDEENTSHRSGRRNCKACARAYYHRTKKKEKNHENV